MVAFLRWAKTSLSALVIILLGGWVALPKCTLVKTLHWIWNKGRLDLDHRAGGGASPRGTKKSSKLELRDKVGGLGGGARCEDVEGPCSALLPRERNLEREWNETFV